MSAPTPNGPVLTVSGLRVANLAGDPVLRGVSYQVAAGELLALVGESGSGKTTAALAALAHFRVGLRHTGGTVEVADQSGSRVELLGLDAAALRRLRGRTIAYVPQDPALSLNPSVRVGRQIAEVLATHGYGATDTERFARVGEVLTEVGLPGDERYQRRYPHQLSGGQQQRVGIAMAFACRPTVVVLDEPTTGLDVTTQALVLRTVRRLTDEHGVAALYITHDLAVVAGIASRVAVMHDGRIVETGTTEQVLRHPGHDYTRRLIASVPHLAGPGDGQPADGSPEPARPLVRAVRLEVSYGANRVLDGIDLSLHAGECVMLLGESGSGKTTLSRCVSGLAERFGGTVELAGQPLAPTARQRSAEQLRDIQYVFQSPFSSLNPRRTVGQSIEVPLTTLTSLNRGQRRERVGEMLERVRLAPAMEHRYPDQLSGGERQRVALARALVTAPRVLVCDEVTSALDVSVQATILDLLHTLRGELGMAMLFVTHNIALARHIADRIAVLRRGRIVEQGPVDQVLETPSHDYTRELLANTPTM